jgi:hypothetical protein
MASSQQVNDGPRGAAPITNRDGDRSFALKQNGPHPPCRLSVPTCSVDLVTQLGSDQPLGAWKPHGEHAFVVSDLSPRYNRFNF